MALDVKSRAKRYEKLDFLGEGQVGGGSRRDVVLSSCTLLVDGILGPPCENPALTQQASAGC